MLPWLHSAGAWQQQLPRPTAAALCRGIATAAMAAQCRGAVAAVPSLCTAAAADRRLLLVIAVAALFDFGPPYEQGRLLQAAHRAQQLALHLRCSSSRSSRRLRSLAASPRSRACLHRRGSAARHRCISSVAGRAEGRPSPYGCVHSHQRASQPAGAKRRYCCWTATSQGSAHSSAICWPWRLYCHQCYNAGYCHTVYGHLGCGSCSISGTPSSRMVAVSPPFACAARGLRQLH